MTIKVLKKNYAHIIKQIDYAIKSAWLYDVSRDYGAHKLLKEDTLKNSLYFHIRRRIDCLCEMYNLRIYTEYNESILKANNMRADIAIVEMDFDIEEVYLGNKVKSVLAIIELKYGESPNYMFQDISKIKNYRSFTELEGCQYYLGILNERDYIDRAFWLDKRQTNNWANGCVTELDACKYSSYDCNRMAFSVYSYNNLNEELNTENIEDMVYIDYI